MNEKRKKEKLEESSKFEVYDSKGRLIAKDGFLIEQVKRELDNDKKKNH